MHLVVIVILLVLGLLQISSSLAMLIGIAKGDGWALLPSEIKDLTHFTWFGTILTFIALVIAVPYVYICGLFKLMFTGEWFK
jgi:hypothetical protein